MTEEKKILRKVIRIILQEANEYEWNMADDTNLMLDEEGMEDSDRKMLVNI